MKEIGLQPTPNDASGGRENGQRMRDFLIRGGRFEKACADLLASGFRLDWSAHDKVKESTSGKRTKYQCPHKSCEAALVLSCDAALWGMGGLHPLCTGRDGHRHAPVEMV